MCSRNLANWYNYYAEATYNGSPEGEFRGETTDVGSFPANRWGLCDMHGNVWEWCEDDWHSSYRDAPEDGRAWLEENATETSKLVRGGSWYDIPNRCGSASRGNLTRDDHLDNIGLRVCCEPPRTLSP